MQAGEAAAVDNRLERKGYFGRESLFMRNLVVLKGQTCSLSS